MSVAGDKRRRDAEEALWLQTKGGLLGGLRWTGYGLFAVTIANFTIPVFRRQTLAIKGFLVTCSTIFGLVVGAETYLQGYEQKQRAEENELRRQARYELAKRGMIATETNIAKWREEQKQALVDGGKIPEGIIPTVAAGKTS
ncbi:hypothetical protein DACRYDRAFT_24998 [Dacryopinax primogenitus]|uniref:HIG1 domain-containing protein n=1 Tax=Dacryopinax primogenitus (strain DJM 731) TaxID=1858805 RepID=M5G1I8_DACPD|nr:uncharacterized protein DACRYDRAFT_24998 [Dacryopinax primogenitus]EJT97622.1 hypothetical protein DACRYDRAFT_24998 [Dacryopinax primogenitus]